MSSPKVHIAVLLPYKVFPARTGGQKCIVLLHQYLGKLRPITFFGTKDNEVSPSNPFSIQSIMGSSKMRYMNPFIGFRLVKRIKEKQITHLIIEHPYMGWLALLVKWSSPIKLIIHSHNIESIRFKSTGKWWWKLLWYYEKWMHRWADGNFFITQEDYEYAIQAYGVDPLKADIITYGIESRSVPETSSRLRARMALSEKYQIPADHKILLFNGSLDYFPNSEAIRIIIDKINPILSKIEDFKYRILICGRNLPAEFEKIEGISNITYAGFVENIDAVFLGADIFINPVNEGGGIKTKLVEALSFNLPCVSTENGAWGIPKKTVNDQLKCVQNNDWNAFAEAILQMCKHQNGSLGTEFFSHFYWGNIANKAASFIDQC